jgi:hypothetical protein
MRSVTRLGPSLVSALIILGLGSTPAHADAQEVFICSFNEGKTIEDLMQVASEFKASIAGLKGGKNYQAQVLTPIASQDLSTVIWVGRMPSFGGMAAFNDDYQASDASMKMTPKFDAIADCRSRSFWMVHPVE